MELVLLLIVKVYLHHISNSLKYERDFFSILDALISAIY